MHSIRPLKLAASWLLAAAGIVSVIAIIGCPGTGALPIVGPTTIDNAAPTLTITEPIDNLSRAQGQALLISWTDSDQDDNAQISFGLINSITGAEVPLVSHIDENDRLGPDSFSAATALVPIGTYFIRGIIDDSINPPVTTFASTPAPANQRVVLTITEPGQVPPTTPPVAVVTAPGFNISVSQDDTLMVTIQPTVIQPAAGTPPYDPDSDVTLYILLDVDTDPTNDNPATDLPGISDGIVVLRQQTIAMGDNAVLQFNIRVDLSMIPARPDGSAYFVRATLSDRTSAPRHAYAVGNIHVTEAAQGMVDVATVGKTRSGVVFQGFNPGSLLGTKMISVGDFDNDGVDDMLLVAQKGNPSNLGNVGEAYLIYGHRSETGTGPGLRFGGDIDVNSTSTTIGGVIFGAPPVRGAILRGVVGTARTDGITDAAAISDLNGDGRPEILFGVAHVDGVWNGRDDDPGDDPPPFGGTTQMVTLALRDGQSSLTVGQNLPVLTTYTGTEDGYIDSAAPGSVNGVGELRFGAQPPGRRWALLKFKDVLIKIPDRAADITNIMATLRMRVVEPGDGGNLFESFRTYNENTTTYANFAPNGGDPQQGVDYGAMPLGGVNGTVGETMVMITPLIQKLIDGELAMQDNELRMIVVPGMAGMMPDDVRLRSSEFNAVQDDRPTLTISYSRRVQGGGAGCYPDGLVNNFASMLNDPNRTIPADDLFDAQGFAVMINSNNRDNQGVINADRLADTVVWLELVGQQTTTVAVPELVPLPTAIAQLAEGTEARRIAGCRFTSGWYEFADPFLLNQPPINDLFGYNVASIADINNDQSDEIIISGPRNERDYLDTQQTFSFSTHVNSRRYTGSILVLPGADYDANIWRDKTGGDGNAQVPWQAEAGNCSTPLPRFGPGGVVGEFEIFAEDVDDFLALGQSAGDFNLDGVSDLLCSAKFNNRSGVSKAGAAYVIYMRVPTGDVRLNLADDPTRRPPMLRVRGEKAGDQIGFSAATGFDLNGDRIDDVFIGSPAADVGGVPAPNCGAGVDLSMAAFSACRESFGAEVFDDDLCKIYDFNNDRQIDGDDLDVLNCLTSSSPNNCCPVDNGFVGVIFGGTSIDGDRTISQIGTPDLPGIRFSGAHARDRAGYSVSSAGDFNNDGFGDLLIAAPGEKRTDNNLRTRVGVAYLIFGGTHLQQGAYSLDRVGTPDLPGIVFISPFVEGRPNEAPIDSVGVVGDINNDGFSDIGLGVTHADFIDQTLPQDPNDPGTIPNIGRRPDDGNVYIIYGNNVGSNRVR